MSHRKKVSWPLVGLCIAVVGGVGFVCAMVFFSAWCGYPLVVAMLVVLCLITAVCCLVSINVDPLKNWLKVHSRKGLNILLACIGLSFMLQQCLAHPMVPVSIVVALMSFYLAYNSLFPRKS